VLIVGELVNRLRNKHEILRDKIRILQDDIRRMVEKQVEGTIGRYVKKKMLAVIIRNLHVEVGKVTFQLREEKAFDINFTIDRF
jgi:trehalose-6-phosphatase